MKTNHLIGEKSPYLLQHAHNPVDWYPWGEAAFQKAKREDKPILLSIGYSTCHWCHVMEEESFSDAGIAGAMNANFVSIKVDREERPDVDRIYMTAVQALTGQGGWPLNVFLTPELKPFFGGTYFPPETRWGQPGFPQLLARIAELWRARRSEIDSDAEKIAESLKAYASAKPGSAALDPSWLDKAFEAYRGAFDPEHAGFGGAPKFPMPVNINFLLRYHARTGNADALRMVKETLRAMAAGGICDQLGGGFHRYSTDAQWRVPHFEKMLYDNAQLAVNYLEAHQASPDPDFARTARETLGYLLRDLRGPQGGFYSAEDADSLAPDGGAKAEGAFYLWTEKELRDALGDAAPGFIERYGVQPGGNAPADPHGEFAGKNILYLARSGNGRPPLEPAKARLRELRSKRPRPALDDKVLASWNGLAISALAKAFAALGDVQYLDGALKAARFMRSELCDVKGGRLYHRWRNGEKAIPAMADDYAFLTQGLIDLYEASFEPEWLAWAIELAEAQNRLFGAPEGGFYLTAEGHDPRLLARVMDDSDNVEPAASSIAALNLLRLAQFTGREEFHQAAEKTLERFGVLMRERPLAMPQMLCALDFALAKPRQIVVAGRFDDPEIRAMLAVVHRRYIPNKIVIGLDAKTRDGMAAVSPFLKSLAPAGERPAAYVCLDYACRLPVRDAAGLKAVLDEESHAA